MGVTVTGTPGNARGVAREAETAPDTPAFLKNEKSRTHHTPAIKNEEPRSSATLAQMQARLLQLRPLARLRCDESCKHLDQKCAKDTKCCNFGLTRCMGASMLTVDG
jgi:hypothetical protein